MPSYLNYRFKLIFFQLKNFRLICLLGEVNHHVHCRCRCEVRGQFAVVGSLFNHVDFRDPTRVVRLSSNHLIGPALLISSQWNCQDNLPIMLPEKERQVVIVSLLQSNISDILPYLIAQRNAMKGLERDSVVNSVCCTCRGLEFGSTCLCQVALLELIPSCGFHRPLHSCA